MFQLPVVGRFFGSEGAKRVGLFCSLVYLATIPLEPLHITVAIVGLALYVSSFLLKDSGQKGKGAKGYSVTKSADAKLARAGGAQTSSEDKKKHFEARFGGESEWNAAATARGKPTGTRTRDTASVGTRSSQKQSSSSPPSAWSMMNPTLILLNVKFTSILTCESRLWTT